MKNNTKRLVLSALFCALIAIFSQIIIPLPSGVPLTLQTFIIALCGFYLGPLYSVITTCTYIFLGLIGLPVFSGFSGGLSAIFGKSGGFIIGFLFLSLLCGFSSKIKKKSISFILIALGILLCHLCGIIHSILIYKIPFIESFVILSFPYLLKDFIFIFIARDLSSTIKKRFN